MGVASFPGSLLTPGESGNEASMGDQCPSKSDAEEDSSENVWNIHKVKADLGSSS